MINAERELQTTLYSSVENELINLNTDLGKASQKSHLE